MTWLIYGANGYTGKLIAQRALERGHRPIVAGRSAESVDAVARELGLEARVFSLDRAAEHLQGVSVVLHCAGPFSKTVRPMVEACLQNRCHYLDITGEIEVLEWVHDQDARAKAAGVALLSGAGFDVVPTDCLARYLCEKLPGAERLELAFGGSSQLSPGTLKTMVENLPKGGRIRAAGKITEVPNGYRFRKVPMGTRSVTVGSIGWGDVATAFHTTGIPNIITYTQVPKSMKWSGLATWVLRFPPAVRLLQSVIARKVKGPDEAHRRQARMFLWGRVESGAAAREATLEVAEGYQFTALSAVAIAEKMEAGVAPGAHTPAGLLGAGFVQQVEGSSPFRDLTP